MSKIIIVNLYGTIFPQDGKDLSVRKGFLNFLGRNKTKHIVISSYAPREITIQDLESVDLLALIGKDKIYTREDMSFVRIYNKKRNDLKDGYPQPMLRAWIRNFRVNEEKGAIFISDNLLDMMAAEWSNVKAIEVPTFKDRNDSFSFDEVSVDSFYNMILFFIYRLEGKPQRLGIGKVASQNVFQ